MGVLSQPIDPPVYKFVTEAQLNKMKVQAKARAEERLQMPPVMDERQLITDVIDEDPAIPGYEKVKTVFTDITYGMICLFVYFSIYGHI